MKKFIPAAVIVFAILNSGIFVTGCTASQALSGSNKNSGVTALPDTGKWTFNVTLVKPQLGRTRMPNGYYNVSFSPGQSLNVYLPYIGQAFGGADVYSGENVLNFVSKDFTVTREDIKANQRRLIFVPKDQKQVQRMTFVIFNNGSASLDIILTNRSPIGFSGNIVSGIK